MLNLILTGAQHMRVSSANVNLVHLEVGLVTATLVLASFPLTS